MKVELGYGVIPVEKKVQAVPAKESRRNANDI